MGKTISNKTFIRQKMRADSSGQPLKSKIIHLALSSSPSARMTVIQFFTIHPDSQAQQLWKSSAPTLSGIFFCHWNIRHLTHASRNLYLPNFFLYYHYSLEMSTNSAEFHFWFPPCHKPSSNRPLLIANISRLVNLDIICFKEYFLWLFTFITQIPFL